MSVTPINNQPIRFQNEETIDLSCDCMGQDFCQFINKNDATKFQLNSSNIVENGSFQTYTMEGWEANGSWVTASGGACYIESSGLGALEQLALLTIGAVYAIEFTLANMNSEGGIIVDSLDVADEYVLDGTHTSVGIATSEDLIFQPFDDLGESFQGCIDDIYVMEIPFYTIRDLDGNIIFEQTDATGITASGGIIQYEIDWSDFEEGCYKIHFSSGGIDYVSDCLTVKLDHDCSILLSWTNDENAFGFDYSNLTFTQKLRVKAKKWQPNYTKEKNVFKDNAGNRTILKSETSKEELLTIAEMPVYLHDALAIGLEHDDFYIDSVKYTNEETEYTPKWRKSSQLAPAEVVVIKDQLLKNNNC